MEKIKLLKRFNSHEKGDEIEVTTATANKFVKDGIAVFIAKEAKTEFETKEKKQAVDLAKKRAAVKKDVTKGPK